MKRHLAKVAALCAALTLLAGLPVHAMTVQHEPCPCDDLEVPDVVVPGLGTW